MKIHVLALALLMAIAAPAAANENYKEHKIYGKNYDKNAMEQLVDESSVPAVVYVDKVISTLTGKFKLDKNKKREDAVLDFIDRHGKAFGLKNPKKELKKDEGAFVFQQYYNGVRVYNKSLGINFNKQWEIWKVAANIVPTPDIDTAPYLTEEEAIGIARNEMVTKGGDIGNTKVELAIYEKGVGNVHLAYIIDLNYIGIRWLIIIDAKTGEIIRKRDISEP